jgi:acetate kinase
MKILVVNAGSSSLKYQLIDMQNENAIAKGVCDRIGLANAFLKGSANGKDFEIKCDLPNHTVAVKLVLETLTGKEHGVIKSMSEIAAVGHRTVHSAEDYAGSVLIDDKVLAVCEANAELAPLHVPANIMGIRACMEVMPNTPMAGVFDTAFHATMPQAAYMYAIPYEAYTDWKIRRYGFHGTSHKYVSQSAAEFLGKKPSELKIVTCHLGNGSSVAAVDGGKSVDTSMGFTPLEGVPMGTRSGDIDPFVVEYLMKKGNMTVGQALDYLNKKSGVLGISGVSSDFRDIRAAADGGNTRAKLALDVFCYRVKKFIGAYAAAMGGLDAIVFTAGIGENTPTIRASILSNLEFLGASYDKKLNDNCPRGKIVDISAKGAKVKSLVVPTNEELVIARETWELVK